MKKYIKLKLLDSALVTDNVVKVFDDVILFETFNKVIFITYNLKIKRIKFHGFLMKRTGFKLIFSAAGKKASPNLRKIQKHPPGIGLVYFQHKNKICLVQ